MKDLHSHILPGIDDGCNSEEESIKLLKDIISSGVNEIVFTPHYTVNTKYIVNNKNKIEIFNKLKKIIKENNLQIKVYLGNEILFCDDILKLINKGDIYTINNSKTLLIEFPMMNLPYNAINVFEELINAGYTIVVAHVERYYFVKNNIDILNNFINMGVYLQGNYTSLFGKYGIESKKVLKKLLKKHMIDILSSDTHHEVIGNEKKIKRKLKWYLKDEEIDKLLYKNFDKLINT